MAKKPSMMVWKEKKQKKIKIICLFNELTIYVKIESNNLTPSV
jgi:hypothetical protein